MKSDERREILARLAKNTVLLKRERKLDLYEPYVKQAEFHALGATTRERGLIAANRVGKSECCASELAMHATGRYPSWWKGKRFTKPVRIWLAGEDGTTVRDVQQMKLCGPAGLTEQHGTGFIPKEDFIGDPSRARGTTDLYDTYHVRHKPTGGVSSVTQKTYGEKRQGFQGEGIDLGWLDEQPPDEIYSECRTRTATTQGQIILSCTPLKGMTEAVARFITGGPGIGYVQMGIYDAVIGHDPKNPTRGHFEREQADVEVAAYPEYQRDARAYGIPQLGSGRIFTIPESSYVIAPVPILPQWAKLWGIDFGGLGYGSHPFAAALGAWDRDNDVLYIPYSFKMQGVGRFQHIPKIREYAADTPVAWPHDGHEKREGSASVAELAKQYKNPMVGMPGLRMLGDHATWPEGGFSTEVAVTELEARMQTDRLKIFDTQTDLLQEIRMYHRDNGLIVKLNDDILSSIYKILMMKRYARPGLLTSQYPPGPDKYRKAFPEEWEEKRPREQSPCDPWTGQPIIIEEPVWQR